MSPKVLENGEELKSGEISDVIKAIEYAEKMGAKVCNLSFNAENNDKILERAIQKSNMLFVVSAGNGNIRGLNIDKVKTYPASYNANNIIAVANLNYNGQLHKSSNFGEKSVDIAAPHVTAIASILFSRHPHAKAVEIKKRILSKAAYRDTGNLTNVVELTDDNRILVDGEEVTLNVENKSSHLVVASDTSSWTTARCPYGIISGL